MRRKTLFISCAVALLCGCAVRPGRDLDDFTNRKTTDISTVTAITTGAWDETIPPVFSPDKKWAASAKNGAVSVARAGEAKGILVASTARVIGFFWGPSENNPKLFINHGRVSNQSTCHAFDPRTGKLVDLSTAASGVFGLFGNQHGCVIACAPDNRKALVEMTGWTNGVRKLRYYVVATDGGEVRRTFSSIYDVPYAWWE